MTTTPDICRNLASRFEKTIAQVYIAASVEALIFEIAILAVIFIRAGFSSFTIMQAIGMSLMLLLIFSAVIHFKKKSIKNKLLTEISSSGILESDLTDLLKQNPSEFEFVHALLIPTAKINSGKEQNNNI